MLNMLLYDSSDFEIICMVAAFFAVSGVLVFWLAFTPKLAKALDKLVGVNTGYYGPVTTLFTFTAAASAAAPTHPIKEIVNVQRIPLYEFSVLSIINLMHIVKNTQINLFLYI